MTETGYNGWSNYETWAVALWLDNEEWSYNEARALVEESGSDYEAADTLKGWLDDMMPDLDATVWADLLRAAFDDVDWLEVAQHYRDE